jgi:hypothetical protein
MAHRLLYGYRHCISYSTTAALRIRIIVELVRHENNEFAKVLVSR